MQKCWLILYFFILHIAAQAQQNKAVLSTSAFGGVSYFTYKNPALSNSKEAQDYYEQLRLGFVYGGDVRYYITQNLTVGLHVNLLQASKSEERVSIKSTNGFESEGSVSDQIRLSELSIQFGYKFPITQNLSIVPTVGAGFLNYSNQRAFFDSSISETALAPTFNGDLKLYYQADVVFGIYAAVGYAINQVEVDRNTSGATPAGVDAFMLNNFSRAFVQIGLSYHFLSGTVDY